MAWVVGGLYNMVARYAFPRGSVGTRNRCFRCRTGHIAPSVTFLLHGHNSVGSPCYHSASPWRNNEALIDSIYIGRRFKNDTERLEKRFQMYTEMTTAERKKPRA